MKRLLIICLLCWAFYSIAWNKKNNDQLFIKDNFSFADKQLKIMLKETAGKDALFPRTTDSLGNIVATDMYNWTSGFFSGNLWYAYENTKDTQLKNAALQWTEKLEPLKTFTQHHDLGFMMYCSYGNAYRITGDTSFKNILVESAKSLATRFDPRVGCIKSWNSFKSWHGNASYGFPVIIDNMMNLELLFFASKATGDTNFKHIAISHALKTMQNQVRHDFSCYHVVCYDTITGQVQAKETAQGYADNSIWSRGQAWGIYGFTVVYRETKDKRFLETAEQMADCYLDNKNLPDDKVPYWDFNANQQGFVPGINSHASQVKGIPRDASAAAVVASALFELASYCDANKAKEYQDAAIEMLHSLSGKDYRAEPGGNAGFLLQHSVGSIAHGIEINVPLVYADYYYLEALKRYSNLLAGKPVI